MKSKEELLAAVDQMAPIVEANFMALDTERTLPKALVDALEQSGLLMMSAPKAVGGSELNLLDQYEVYKAVGYLDGSLCWTMMTTGTSISWPAGYLSDEAANVLYFGERIPRVSTSVLPAGTAVKVANGYRLNGRWGFASGVFHAEWLLAGGMLELEDSDQKQRMFFMFPAADATIIDNWHAAGLRGSGSGSFEVNDLFVPEHFSWAFDAKLRRPTQLHKLGLMGFVINEHPGLALGVARRALDEITKIAVNTSSRFRGKGLADREVFQNQLAIHELRWQAADALAKDIFKKLWGTVVEEDSTGPSDKELAQARAAGTFISKEAIENTSFAFRLGGGRAIMEDHILQRCLRDIQAVSQHFLTSGVSYENYGKFLVDHPEANLRG